MPRGRGPRDKNRIAESKNPLVLASEAGREFQQALNQLANGEAKQVVGLSLTASHKSLTFTLP